MTRYAGRNAILPPLNGFAAQFATAVGGLVFIEFVFSYPGAGFTLQQAALGSDYPLTQGLLLVFSRLRDRRELHHGHPQLRPRPARARELGGAHVADPAGPGVDDGRRGGGASRSACRRRRRAPPPAARLPLWLRLLLANPKSRGGPDRPRRDGRSSPIFAPLIATHDPTAFSLFDAKPVAVVAPLLRDDRPGHRHLLAGRLGLAHARCSWAPRPRAARRPWPRPSASSPPTPAAGSTRSSTSRRTSSS